MEIVLHSHYSLNTFMANLMRTIYCFRFIYYFRFINCLRIAASFWFWFWIFLWWLLILLAVMSFSERLVRVQEVYIKQVSTMRKW